MRTPVESRFLERALIFSFVAHGAGMLTMAVLLLPGMPGTGASELARFEYVAGHPWGFRLGWFPWQVTAVSDLLIGVGLVRTAWIPKWLAVLTLLITVAAVVPDQAGQAMWVTRGVELARTGDAAAYLALEARIFPWTAVWGGTLYTVAALGWTACFAGRAWSPLLTAVSAVVWPLFAYVNTGPFLPAALGPSPAVVAQGNALGFVLLEAWFVLVTEQVLRRTEPVTRSGRWAPWRHPARRVGRVVDAVANSRFVRALGELLPPVAMVSDITDVVYVSYLAEAERLLPHVPEGLTLQRVGPEGRLAVFTFLTFRHGHFGPAFLGPLRRLLPSPIQSNWRIHVRHPASKLEGVHFVTNATSSALHALGARFLAEGIPMHVVLDATLEAGPDGVELRLDPGNGTAPDATARLTPSKTAPANGPWATAFPTFRDMLEYVVPQDRALSTQPGKGRLTHQEIFLGIPLDACEPLEGTVQSRAARAIVGDAQPFCFRVAGVRFRFDAEGRKAL